MEAGDDFLLESPVSVLSNANQLRQSMNQSCWWEKVNQTSYLALYMATSCEELTHWKRL